MSCPNPVAIPDCFGIEGFNIYWYGILISLSVVLAVYMVYRQAKKQGIDTDSMLDYALLTVPVAILCARIYYVIFEWEGYKDNLISILYIWKGGIAIYGAIIGGVIATLIFSKWKKIGFWTLADLVAPGLVLGQAIGRWGNFFNQEAYGQPVIDEALQFFPVSVYIQNCGLARLSSCNCQVLGTQWHQATFFYESMACLLIFAFLLIYRAKAKKAPAGNLFLWYWVLYGIERFFVEGLRTDSLYIFKGGLPIGKLIFFPAGLRVSQVLSLIMVIAFGIILLKRFIARRKEVTKPDDELAPELVLINTEEEPAADSEPAEEAAEETTEEEIPEEPAEETAEEQN